MRSRYSSSKSNRTLRLSAYLLLCTSALAAAFSAEEGQPDPPLKSYTRGVLIRFEGPITPLSEGYLLRHLDAAQGQGVDLVVIEFDSPGGYLQESLNIAERLRGTAAHTVAYVPREALSGAAIAALGCDEIIMGPTARLGDAGPIYLGEDALFRHAPEKIKSDLARRVRDLAEAKGRPPALAEAMVDMDLPVYHARHAQTGQEKFLSEHEIAASGEADQWQKLKPVFEARKGHFLTVNGQQAVELTLAQGVATSRDELRQRYPVTESFKIVVPGWIDTTVYILNLPLVTAALFIIGLVALYIEFSAPGIGLGGVTAGICFVLFFWSRFLGGTADWLEIILFVTGIVFLGIEIFVTPGFGVMGVAGIVLMVAGVVLASQDFVLPRTDRDLNTLTGSLVVVLGSGVAFTVTAVILSQYLGSMPVFNRLVLKPPSAKAQEPAVKTGADGKRATPAQSHGEYGVQVGDWGLALSLLRPAGKARFGDRYLDVVTDGSFVDQGRQVQVVEISGNRIVVREVEGSDKVTG